MILTLDLPPDLEARLNSEAARRGLSPSGYLLELVKSTVRKAPAAEDGAGSLETESILTEPWPEDEPRPTTATWRHLSPAQCILEVLDAAMPGAPSPATPAELVDYWEREGLLGIWADRTDIPDSPEYARQLRHQAEQRAGWQEDKEQHQ